MEELEVIKPLTIAQCTSLFSTPVALVPSVTGFAVVGRMGIFTRTGTRFATGAGNISIRITGESGLAQFAGSASIIWTGTNTPACAFATSPTAGGGGATDTAGSFGSKGAEIVCATANPTVDATNTGSVVLVYFRYIQFPTDGKHWGALMRDFRRAGILRR